MESTAPPIEVSHVEILPIRHRDGHFAFASAEITIGGRYRYSIANLALYTRPNGNGYRIVYPSKRDFGGREIPSFCPLHRESAALIESAIIGHLENLIKKTNPHDVNKTQTKLGENNNVIIQPPHF